MDGEVKITLDGRPETLRCSLRSGKIVSAMSGGFQGALGRLANMDFEAYAAIVAAGLNKRPAEIEEAVYATGLPELTEPLSQFVLLLANGGRPIGNSRGDNAGEA